MAAEIAALAPPLGVATGGGGGGRRPERAPEPATERMHPDGSPSERPARRSPRWLGTRQRRSPPGSASGAALRLLGATGSFGSLGLTAGTLSSEHAVQLAVGAVEQLALPGDAGLDLLDQARLALLQVREALGRHVELGGAGLEVDLLRAVVVGDALPAATQHLEHDLGVHGLVRVGGTRRDVVGAPRRPCTPAPCSRRPGRTAPRRRPWSPRRRPRSGSRRSRPRARAAAPRSRGTARSAHSNAVPGPRGRPRPAVHGCGGSRHPVLRHRQGREAWPRAGDSVPDGRGRPQTRSDGESVRVFEGRRLPRR